MMNPVDTDKLPLKATPLGGKARTLIDKPELRLVKLVLAPGEPVGEDVAPVDVVFLALAGSGTLTAGQEQITITAGQMATCPAGITRSLRANKKEQLVLLVIRVPNL